MSAIPLSADLFPKPNLSLVLYGKNDLRLETWPLPDKLEPDGWFEIIEIFTL